VQARTLVRYTVYISFRQPSIGINRV